MSARATLLRCAGAVASTSASGAWVAEQRCGVLPRVIVIVTEEPPLGPRAAPGGVARMHGGSHGWFAAVPSGGIGARLLDVDLAPRASTRDGRWRDTETSRAALAPRAAIAPPSAGSPSARSVPEVAIATPSPTPPPMPPSTRDRPRPPRILPSIPSPCPRTTSSSPPHATLVAAQEAQPQGEG